MNEFCGFPEALADFWFELHEKNTVQDADVIKEQYRLLITEPLAALYDALLPTVLAISEHLELHPARCISSPYTDRRFSRGTPFKEYMYLRFKQSGKKEDVPGLYFDMGVQMYSFGLRIYKQTAQGMQRMRENLLDHREAAEDALEAVQAAGFVVIGEDYKTDHFPDVADGALKALLNKRSFHIGKNVDVSQSIFTVALADEISAGFRQMAQIFRLFVM